MREKLIDILSNYFRIGNSYHYMLERIKEAFGMGTMSLEDFREYDEDDVAEIAEHLIQNGVTIQQWIPVTERLPDKNVPVLVFSGGHCYIAEYYTWHILNSAIDSWSVPQYVADPTHWMPLPELPGEV